MKTLISMTSYMEQFGLAFKPITDFAKLGWKTGDKSRKAPEHACCKRKASKYTDEEAPTGRPK